MNRVFIATKKTLFDNFGLSKLQIIEPNLNFSFNYFFHPEKWIQDSIEQFELVKLEKLELENRLKVENRDS